MADAKDEPKKQDTDEDFVAGATITPSFGNRFTVTVNPSTTRIAVGEFVEGDARRDTNYHTVFVTTTADAVQLAALILRLVAANQAAQKKPEDKDDNG